MKLSERLARVRKHVEKQQIEFAEELGVSARSYANYERDVSEPPISLCVDICKKYNISAEWMFLDSGDMFETKITTIIERAIIDTRQHMIKNNVTLSPEKEAALIVHLFEQFMDNPSLGDESINRLFKMAS